MMRMARRRIAASLLAGLLAGSLGAPATALAQGASRDDFIAAPGAGQWSANDFLGLTVHNGEGEELGPVIDVLTGGGAAAGLKPLFLELRISEDDLAMAPPFGADPKRIPAVAP
jgi:hypothetical protein